MSDIHPLAVISESAEIGQNVSIGPFCIVEPGAVIGDNVRLFARSVVKTGTVLGKNNTVHEGAVLGGHPQHTSPPEKLGNLVIGEGNTLRENVTIHLGLHEGAETRIGNNNLIMVNAHIGHDCIIGNHTIIVNNVMIAGHVTVDDRAYVSGAVAVHQFCRIGRNAMVGGQAAITRDVPPFVTVHGATSQIVGLNLIGLRRSGFSSAQIAELKAAYRTIYRQGLSFEAMKAALSERFTTGPAAEFPRFFSESKRGFTPERRNRTAPLKFALDDVPGLNDSQDNRRAG